MRALAIRCNCGQRIVARDLVQRTWHARVFGPSFVYIKYRCSRCKKMGERMIEQQNWDESLLRETQVEVSLEEKRRFEKLGKITAEEEIEFHFALDNPETLKELRGQSEEAQG